MTKCCFFRYDSDVQYIPTTSTTPTPNQTLPPAGMASMFSGNVSGMRNFSDESTSSFPQQQLQSQLPNQQLYLAQNGNPANIGLLGNTELSSMSSNYPPQHANALNTSLQPAAVFQNANNAYNQTTDPRYKDNLVMNQNDSNRRQVSSAAPERNPPETDPARTQYLESQSAHPVLPKSEQSKFYPAPFIAGIADPNANFDNNQPYYFATNPGTSQPEGFLPTGVTPLFFTQAAQQVESNSNSDPDGGLSSQFANQQFFILSPAAIPNSSEKNGSDYDNFKHMMMPVTPIHMYPASYIQGGAQNENQESKSQAWGIEASQHFVFSAADPNVLYGSQAEQDSNYPSNQAPDGAKKPQQFQTPQQQAYFPAALTPLTVMPSQGNNFFSGWFTANQPPLNTQLSVASSGQNDDEGNKFGASQQYATLSNASQSTFSAGSSAESQAAFLPKQDQYYKPELPDHQSLPSVGQWASTSHAQIFSASQPPPHQWMDSSSQNVSVSHAVSSGQNLSSNTSAVSAKATLKSQMPPLAPIDKLPATNFEETANRSLPEVQTFSVALKDDKVGETPEPKPASISNRLKRFSRDRLVASVDSPGIFLPPMTPLTPALTPTLLAGIGAAANPENLSAKAEENPPEEQSEKSVFQFPPSHVSRRIAALRVEGAPIDSADSTKAAAASTVCEEKRGDAVSEGNDSEASKSAEVSSQATSKAVDERLESGSNMKQALLLSIPPSCWTTEASDVKPNTDQLKNLSGTLTTPTNEPSPSNLTTPTHQLNTPNKGLNTPTQPLNTPTQPLNTPTDVISPVPLSFLSSSDEKPTPVKPLMPVPSGKKRKTDTDSENADLPQKQTRYGSLGSDFEQNQENVSPSAERDESELSSGSVSIKKFGTNEDVDAFNEKTKIEDTNSNFSALKSSIPDTDCSLVSTQIPIKVTPPVFSAPSTEAVNAAPINTPVFVPSNAILRRSSGADRPSSSTPPFFTFIPGSAGLPTPMFLAPVEQFDSKPKQGKEKPSENVGTDGQGGSSPMKRIPSSLSLCGKYLTDDGLQTPSKIPVVTPSVVLSAGISSDAQQVFCFPQVIPHLYKSSGTPDKNKSKPEEADPDNALNPKPSEKSADGEKKVKSSNDDHRIRPPSLVVDPPSDTEDENKKRLSLLRKSPSPSNSSLGKSDKPPLPVKVIDFSLYFLY